MTPYPKAVPIRPQTVPITMEIAVQRIKYRIFLLSAVWVSLLYIHFPLY